MEKKVSRGAGVICFNIIEKPSEDRNVIHSFICLRVVFYHLAHPKCTAIHLPPTHGICKLNIIVLSSLLTLTCRCLCSFIKACMKVYCCLIGWKRKYFCKFIPHLNWKFLFIELLMYWNLEYSIVMFVLFLSYVNCILHNNEVLKYFVICKVKFAKYFAK